MKPKLHFRRFEFKYILPASTADKIIPALLQFMDWDSYVAQSEKDHYTVNSLYYDSAGFGCYDEKVAGVRRRSKFRLRYYNDLREDSSIFTEIKRKYDAVVIKDRSVLSLEQAKEFFYKDNLKSLPDLKKNDKETLEEFLWAKNHNGMMPAVLVSYTRRPLVSKHDERFRVTFDSNITACRADWLGNESESKKDVLKEDLVLELKFNNHMPLWFYEIIEEYRLNRIAFSKYCNSLETIYPFFTP